MEATQTVYQFSDSRNPSNVLPAAHTAKPTIILKLRNGVVTLFGYGINVRVDRGHLILEDGIGAARQSARFPRVGHGLRRVVIIGSDGLVSLAALRWLADQDVGFAMLDRRGSVLATTGPSTRPMPGFGARKPLRLNPAQPCASCGS